MAFPQATIELDYPLYSVEFDAEDAQRLIVGGGGGAGRSGVGNKISVLETSTQTELQLAGELSLSRDEDSVMSLAIGAQRGKMTTLYAGVNSSPASVAAGRNEHLRTIALEQARARSSSSSTTAGGALVKPPVAKLAEVSRTSLFSNPDTDMFQRLLKVKGGVGVAATGLGKESQIAFFDAGANTSKLRGALELPTDAEDLDIVQTGEGQFQVAFCYKYELHVVNVGKETSDPKLIYTMPEENSERPIFRCIRYLTPHFILAMANLPTGKGPVILGLRLPTPGHENARLAVNTRIPRPVRGVGLAVTNLHAPASLTAPIPDTQFLVAVASNDGSIFLYTLEHISSSQVSLLANLHPLTTIKDAHKGSITGLAFSTFVTPKTHLRPQFIKLASISLVNSVTVNTIPLKRHIDKTPRNKKGPPRPARYVVAMESKAPSGKPLLITLTVIVLIMAVLGQGLVELYGNRPPILHVHKLFPGWHHGTLRSPDHPPPFFAENDFLAKLVGTDQSTTSGEKIVLREADQPTAEEGEEVARQDVLVDLHTGEALEDAKEWHELHDEQKEAWKEKLSEAGKWSREMGEGVFKGILFGELAGAVAQAVGG